jgi:ferredoxin-NADP reductase
VVLGVTGVFASLSSEGGVRRTRRVISVSAYDPTLGVTGAPMGDADWVRLDTPFSASSSTAKGAVGVPDSHFDKREDVQVDVKSCNPRGVISTNFIDYLYVASALTFAYLCVGELLPVPVLKNEGWNAHEWQRQQVVSISTLSCLAVLLGSPKLGIQKDFERNSIALRLFTFMNVVPIATAVASTTWMMRSDNCPLDTRQECKPLSVMLDSIGLVTARLARLDLGICLLLATRGQSGWLFRATGGLLGFTESIPAHRAAGWWCVTQSVLHSSAYLSFYVHEVGVHSLLRDCFPTPKADGVNRLGLVNGFGVVACFAALGITASATIWVRRSHYHVFQRTHLPLAALFVLCCALHDLEILLFAAPGIADWYLGRHGKGAFRTMPASAKVLRGTSGPWIELEIIESDENVITAVLSDEAPRGQWMNIRVMQLGQESHPFDVASVIRCSGISASGQGVARPFLKLSAIVSAKAGNWSEALAALVDHNASTQLEINMNGPFPSGGSNWMLPGLRPSDLRSTVSSRDHDIPALLLLAGGTGITGWLPALEAARDGNITVGQQIHLVWCVHTEADYLALADRLPHVSYAAETQERDRGSGDERDGAFRITVYVTRRATRMPTGIASMSSGSADHSSVVPSVSEVTNKSPSFRFSVKGEDDPRREGKICVAGTSPLISLLAAVAGLVMQHYAWWGWVVRDNLVSSPQTIVGHAVVLRILPVALIIGVMSAATALGRCVFVFTTSAPRTEDESESISFDQEMEEFPLLSRETTSMEAGVMGACFGERSKEHDSYAHDVRFGRPDFGALASEEATRLLSLQDIHNTSLNEPPRLHAVTCGPESMVNAVRDGCETARKTSNQRVRVEFSAVRRSA